MSKRAIMLQNRVGFVLAVSVIFVLLALTAYYWNEWIIRTNKEGVQDYVGLTFQALVSDPIGLLFYQTEGSAPYLKFFSIGIAWIWGSYAYQTFQKKFTRYTYFWGNIYWCVYATAFIMIAWVYGAAMQHYGWYACYHHCYPGEEGTMDKISHFMSPAAIAAIVLTVDIMGLLGLKGRLGRAVEISIVFLTIVFIAVRWEYTEAMNPARYASIYMNSLTDMLAGALGAATQVFAYNWIVPYEE